MTTLILAVSAALVLAAPPAFAGIPDPGARSIVPAYIDLVGCKDGVVDPYGAFTVTINDASGFPVQGCEVRIVFASDLKIYTASPGVTVDCAGHSVTTISDASGVARFDLAGATINTNGVATGTGLNGATISACDITIGRATVAVFDENGALGSGGVASNDMAAWLGDFAKQGTIGYKGRSDFSHDGNVASNDLSLWLKLFGGGQSAQSCGTLCP